jgi:hypothetical protein
MKGAATRRLLQEQLHPFTEWCQPEGKVPMCWAAKLWKVYLGSEEEIARAIVYVEQNPEKEGKPRQHWSFESRFEPTGVD